MLRIRSPVAAKLILGAFAFLILAVSITTRHPKWLTDFDQSVYISIAYDLDRHGVFSNGILDRVDSIVTPPPAGMFIGPAYPLLVLAAMRADARFDRAVACAIEAYHRWHDGKTCEVYARPMLLLHAALLALGVLAIACSAEMLLGNRAAFWLTGIFAIAGLLGEVQLFSFVMTEAPVFALYSLTFALLLAGLKTSWRGWFTAAGCVLALLCLTRASYLVLAPVTFGLIAIGRRFTGGAAKPQWNDALAFAVAFAVIFSPWIVRNGISVGKFAVSEEYGSAALIERFAFNRMTAREFVLAFPYCVPTIGPPAVGHLFGDEAMDRFEWNKAGSFFHVGRATRLRLIETHQKLDPIIAEVTRNEMAQNWWRHLAVSLPLGWCGLWMSETWSLFLLPLFAAACVVAARRRDFLFLLFALPGLVMVGLHAVLANHYARYNIGLIGPYSIGGAWIIVCALLPRLRSIWPAR